jgi:hypothetical protein
MTNEELETLEMILCRGEIIPLEEVTWEQMCDPASLFPRHYDFGLLPLETQGAAMLAPLEIKRLLDERAPSWLGNLLANWIR